MKKRNIFWGLMCILAAILLLLSKLGMFGGMGFWSLMFTVFLVILLIRGMLERNFACILFSIAFLLIVYDKPLGIEELTPWTVLGVAALGSCGLSFLFPKKKENGHFYTGECEQHRHMHQDYYADAEEDGYIRQRTKFGSTTKYVNCNDFRRADLECSFGAMAVYFDKAVVKSGKAHISVQVSFAGVELYIPKEWTVINAVNASMGRAEEKNRNYPDGSVVLTIDGTVRCAGVDIIYV